MSGLKNNSQNQKLVAILKTLNRQLGSGSYIACNHFTQDKFLLFFTNCLMPNNFYTPSFIVENNKESGSDETPSNFTNEKINANVL